MWWNIISLIGTIVTVGFAIASIIAWRKSSDIYLKIAGSDSVEKLTHAQSYLASARESYNLIKNIYRSPRQNEKEIIKKLDHIESSLEKITTLLPTRHEEISSLCIEQKKVAGEIIANKQHLDAGSDFLDMDTRFTEIENAIKIKQEQLRGF